MAVPLRRFGYFLEALRHYLLDDIRTNDDAIEIKHDVAEIKAFKSTHTQSGYIVSK